MTDVAPQEAGYMTSVSGLDPLVRAWVDVARREPAEFASLSQYESSVR